MQISNTARQYSRALSNQWQAKNSVLNPGNIFELEKDCRLAILKKAMPLHHVACHGYNTDNFLNAGVDMPR